MKMPFGKHAGVEISEITELSYIVNAAERRFGDEALHKALVAEVRRRVNEEAQAQLEEYAAHLRAALEVFARYAAHDAAADEWLDRAQGLVFTSRLKGRAK